MERPLSPGEEGYVQVVVVLYYAFFIVSRVFIFD